MGPGQGDSSQALDPFRDGVDELRLFLEVLVEQEMQRVEHRSGSLPPVWTTLRIRLKIGRAKGAAFSM
jgi:hypothetical protein